MHEALSLLPRDGVDFGPGAVARVGTAVRGLRRRRAFLVTDRGMPATGIVDRVRDLLLDAGVATAVFSGVDPNPSTDTIDEAVDLLRGLGDRGDSDDTVVVAVGGGSALDAAKGIALLAVNQGPARSWSAGVARRAGLPVVAVPTTAGTGAETNGFGVIEDRALGCKVYIGDASVRPVLTFLDPELTLGLPASVTASTGMDALTHGIESLASRGSTAASQACATEAVRLVGAHLARAVVDGRNLEARSGMLLGAHLAGLALSTSGLGLVHGIGHAVTSHTGAAHGLALTAVLDAVMSRSLDVAAPAYRRVAEALDLDASPSTAPEAAVAAVRDLGEAVGARRRLSDLGVRDDQVASIAAGALADAVSANHPRRFEQADVERLLLENLQQP